MPCGSRRDGGRPASHRQGLPESIGERDLPLRGPPTPSGRPSHTTVVCRCLEEGRPDKGGSNESELAVAGGGGGGGGGGGVGGGGWGGGGGGGEVLNMPTVCFP